ncbi:MAG: hypothetical protein LBT17_02665 [Mycoplasmataceae bacterium]|nr:hypothetical protein [Mycoplasmataceae bacterium]
MKINNKKYIFTFLGFSVMTILLLPTLTSCGSIVKFTASFDKGDDYYTDKGIEPIEPEDGMKDKYNSQTALSLLTHQENVVERTKCAFQRWALHSIQDIWKNIPLQEPDSYTINFSYVFNLKNLNLDFQSSWSNESYQCFYQFRNYRIAAAGWNASAEKNHQATLILSPINFDAEVVSEYKLLTDTNWTTITNHNTFAIGGHSLDAIGVIQP